MPLFNPARQDSVSAELSTASYSLTTNAYESVGCTLASLKPGRWHVTGKARIYIQTSAGSGYAICRLYNTTAAAAISNSEHQGPIATATGVTFPFSIPINKEFTLSATSTIDLQVVTPAGATYTARTLYTDTDGRTGLTAVYLGPS